MKEITDEALLTMLCDHSTKEKGFKLLMDRYQERLYWHVRRLVMDHDDADDVVQNTFIKVFRNIHTFEGKSKLYTWLYRIATNEAITFLSSKKRKQSTSLDEHTVVANTLRADTYFDGAEVQVKLKSAIEQLPDKQKIVFNLRYYEEMPYEEMSQVLDTSVGALKASYHHAVKKLKPILKQNQHKEMKNKEEIKVELEELAPFLAKIKNQKEGFKVPAGYFETLQKEVLRQVELSAEPPILSSIAVKKTGLLRATWFRPAMAAAVVGVAICAVLFLYFQQSKSSTQLANLTHEEVSHYVSNNLDDFEEDLLIKNSAALFEAPTNLIKTEDIDNYIKESIDDLDIEELENL